MTPERYAELRAIYLKDRAPGEIISDDDRAAIREFIDHGVQLAELSRERRYAEYRAIIEQRKAEGDAARARLAERRKG